MAVSKTEGESLFLETSNRTKLSSDNVEDATCLNVGIFAETISKGTGAGL